MADQVTTVVEVDASIQELVAADIQEVLTATAIMPPLVTDVTSLSVPGAKSIDFPKMTNFAVTKKLPGVPVPAQAQTLTADKLELDQHGVIQFLIEDVAELQSAANLTESYIGQASKDLAVEMDQYILDALEAGTSASAPDHRRAYAGASLAKVDVILARTLLNTAKVPVADRSMVVSPDSEGALLNISEFVRVDESGGSEALRNGRIGRLFGFDVFMTPLAEDAKSMAFHKSALVFGRQKQPSYDSAKALELLAMRHSLDHLYGAEVMDSGKRQVLLGSAS